MKRSLIFASFLIVGSLAGGLSARSQSFPFSPNSKSYTQYLNSLQWRDGKVRKFFGLVGCEDWTGDYTPLRFGCRKGYVKITDPLGSRSCEISKGTPVNDATAIASEYDGDNWYTFYGYLSCR